MLQHYIEGSIADIQALLEITREDIKDIREANHEAVFSRMKSKEDLIDSFFSKKEEAKKIIHDLVAQQPGVEVKDLIGDEAVALFDQLNECLITLKEENFHFAKISIAVGEFYRSMLNNLLPSQPNYDGKRLASDVKFIAVDA